ncbi:polar amino acid transport system substrate-binding protein [Pseudomonas fluvialis]|uniref:Polar amino acid transport system substrate-binding protein n=1 Tax=Pseudomonas fluvialis TaxID=1793966 RepID=A0A7X0BRA4_9PSED|nr:transporter substrate-binding domain-containing protein [Pseudomonas fluvialis]MBB6341182.1 polar amino acid transport system substrate-binding protein [Pseudomonas fluvialis]
MRFLLLLLWLYGGLPAVAAEETRATHLTFCYEDKESFPWVMPEGRGLNLLLLKQVAAALDLQVRWVAVPWRRCLAGLEKGVYEGAFAASYMAERLAQGAYPLDNDGRVDESKRLHTQAYALYSRKDDAVGWNGSEFRQLQGSIGTLSGFSIVDFLRLHGAVVVESSRDPEALLYMLATRRVQAVALQVLRADHVLQSNAELAAVIDKASLPLETKAYYLMLSHQLQQRQPQLARQIWEEVQRQRDSTAYREQMNSLLQP